MVGQNLLATLQNHNLYIKYVIFNIGTHYRLPFVIVYYFTNYRLCKFKLTVELKFRRLI